MEQQKDVITKLIVGKLDKDLECLICTYLVVGPRECEVCQSLACNDCSVKNNEKCGNKCGKGISPIGRIHKSYRNKFDDLKIECI